MAAFAAERLVHQRAPGPFGSTSEVIMGDPVEALILDLLEWLAPEARPYAEVMDAWRTSCPRLPVWEEANDRGLVRRHGSLVALTLQGREHLAKHRVRGAFPQADS